MEEEKQKTTFLFVFLTYLPVFLLKFWSRELIGCRIKICIQRVPNRHTFDGPRYPKNKKYLKKWNDDISPCVFTQIPSGIACWMQNLIPHPTSSHDRNFSKNTGRYVKNPNKKSSSFFDTYPQIYIKKVFKTYTVFQI